MGDWYAKKTLASLLDEAAARWGPCEALYHEGRRWSFAEIAREGDDEIVLGPVGSIPDKIRAAAREGYRTVLVPREQIHDERWNLNELGFQLNVTVKEVDTIDEAYQLMTGQRI